MNDFDSNDLHKALAAFLMCFGEGLPQPLKVAIRDRTHALAMQIEHGGEPTVAKLTRGLGDALVAAPQPSRH